VIRLQIRLLAYYIQAYFSYNVAYNRQTSYNCLYNIVGSFYCPTIYSYY